MRGNIAKNATVEEEWGGHSGAKLDVRERVESGIERFAVSCESTTPSNETPKILGAYICTNRFNASHHCARRAHAVQHFIVSLP